MGEGNDTLVGLSEGNNSIVGDVQATFADTANDVLRSNETYTEDIQRRREAWSTLAQELGIDEGLVEVTNRIQVKGVADFYLDDSEDASYEELLNGEKGGLENLPELSVRDKLLNFMSTWTNIQQKSFLVDILKMDISKKCWGNFYHFKQDSLLGFAQQIFIKGLIIENDVPTTGRDTFVDQNSVRRVYN